MDTYTNSKGESMLIKDMENPHLVHSIAKLALAIGAEALWMEKSEAEELLKALKREATERMFVQE